MPLKKTSYDSLLRDWESLLEACNANAGKLPDVVAILVPLEAMLQEVKELRQMRMGLEGSRRRLTRNLRDACEAGRESARRVRGLVKSRLGTRAEALEEFGIAPIRPRVRRQGK